MFVGRSGSRGVSIIFSSGDGGVGDGNANPATQRCFSNDGKNQTIFIPGFPASCPLYVVSTTVPPLHMNSHQPCRIGSVTAVGGTQGFPEIAARFSGGGFSNYVSLNSPVAGLLQYCIDMEKQKFARPDWQTVAVQNYLDNLPSGQYQGLFNPCVPFPFPSIPIHLVLRMPLSLPVTQRWACMSIHSLISISNAYL